MATPTTNFVPVTGISPLATGLGRYLVAGTKWGGDLGSGVSLTYSFPAVIAYCDTDFFGNPIFTEWNSWSQLSSGERAATRDSLSRWDASANINFQEVADNSRTVGELRFTYTVGDPGNVAHAYLPSSDPSAGDIWFDLYGFNRSGNPIIPRGTYDYQTILHEVGHALGLKHSFGAPNAIPASLDNYFYTVMSYTASPWSNDNYATFYPTTPMYYDLVAIQALYGKNTTVNGGNNTYSFNDGTRYWQAINDAAGYDAIVYNGIENSSINLNPGRFSALSETIFFSSGSSRATVTIGPGVVIEKARGGSGNDNLIGNGVANVLNGAAGADKMQGGAGNDFYLVDNAGDVVNESLAGSSGIDTVQSSIGFNLANTARVVGPVENLTLLGAANINAAGNTLNNLITGNAGSNVLYGAAGNDTLNGAAGADNMRGLAGNDFYLVDNAGDVVNESLAGSTGIDTVQSSIGFNLANTARVVGPVENLTLLGAASINAAGNTLNNLITGNAGSNVLYGAAGADNMRGLAGNDIYLVDNAGDVVNESLAGSTGIDTVQSSIGFNLANTARVVGPVENLTLLGAANIDAAGNTLNNLITGNAGSNVLDGSTGDDTLNGGAGSDELEGREGADTMAGGTDDDAFVFGPSASESAFVSRDIVLDFQSSGAAGGDVLRLSGEFAWAGQIDGSPNLGDVLPGGGDGITQIGYIPDADNTYLVADTNDDGQIDGADFMIEFRGVQTFTPDDFDNTEFVVAGTDRNNVIAGTQGEAWTFAVGQQVGTGLLTADEFVFAVV